MYILFISSYAIAQETNPFSASDFRFVSQETAGAASGNPSSQLHYWVDDFETSSPKWVDDGGDCTHQLILRQRETGDAMSGRGFEHLQVQTETKGTSILLGYPIVPVELRQELLIQLAVNANRTGIQLLAHVVLPQTQTPQGGGPVTFYVSGGVYSSVEHWQKLRIDEILRYAQLEIAKKERESGGKIVWDAQNAYVDRIVLNVYTGPGNLDLQVDSLEISGVQQVNRNVLASQPGVQFPAHTQPQTNEDVSEAEKTPGSGKNPQLQNFPPIHEGNSPSVVSGIAPAKTYDLLQEKNHSDVSQIPSGSNPSDLTENESLVKSTQGGNPSEFLAGSNAGSESIENFKPKTHKIHLNQSTVMINDVPIFVRAIRHHGESLEFLASLGFNTIWLEAPPTRLMEAEAALLNIWFICPPPADLSNPDANPSQIVRTNELSNCLLNRVLAWDLGRTPTTSNVPKNPDGTLIKPTEFARQQIQLLNQIPETQIPNRPSIVIPGKDFSAYSTTYDILMLERNPLNSTMSFVSYGLWFREMLNLVQEQKSIFVKIPTQFDPLLREQWTQMNRKINEKNGSGNNLGNIPDSLPLEQLRLLTYNAAVAGAHGLLFESTARLDSPDEETVFRAKSLELVNREMLILEQWLSQGEKFSTLPSNRQDVAGAVLAGRYVRILFPMVLTQDSQYVCGAGADRKISFLVRGLPETYQCWLYSLSGLSPISNHRTAGGVELELEELPLVATVVMTQNSLIINSITQRILHQAPRLAQLMKELAEIRLRNWLQLHGTEELKGNNALWYERAKIFLSGAEKALYAHEYADAFILAQRATRPIAYMEHQHWKEFTAPFPSPNFLPTATSFRSLPIQESWGKTFGSLTEGNNLLPGGDLDDVRAVSKNGWNHFQSWNAFDGVIPRADITSEAAHSGQNGLKLEITASDRLRAPMMFDSPPIMIRSPGVPVGPEGTIYQVELWVNIPTRIVNSVDGLKITDSNSGEVLAERRMVTNGWQKISFQRVTRNSNPVYVYIAMTGYGVAYVDDVKVFPLQ